MTRIAAPKPPAPAAPFRFPVVASVAPLLVAVALWLVTDSPYSLLFALLGPVTAVAGLADARLGSRRSRRRERDRFAVEARAARDAIDAAHAEERATLLERSPAAGQLIERRGADPWRWTASGSEVPITLGLGRVPSGVTLEGETDAELELRAARVEHAPVVVDAALSIGIAGPGVLAAAVARALVVEIAWNLSPGTFSCSGRESWLGQLPHFVPRPAREGLVAEFCARGENVPLAVVATAESPALLPGECRIVLSVTPEGAALVQHPDRARRGALRPPAVSAVAAGAWARSLADAARQEGLVTSVAGIPESVGLAGLLGPVPARELSAGGLECVIGVDADGPVGVDLVAQGPHAVVGGATGSGKSELLVTWVVAMAAVCSPSVLTVLLIDFKGGSAFAPLERLPHTVGIVTDLDEHRAARALASLRAELRHRERVLAEAGARDVREIQALPRLVIVVDEFARVLDDHPELHALFADIAARGRSLGVHLVLCTQRPAGVVRDAVLANVDLRLCMRVNNRADSVSVVGTDAAAQLEASARGRGILTRADADPRTVQFALTSDADVRLVAGRWSDVPPPRRPWCEPLPATVPVGEAAGGFGLLDVPELQRREVARWDPALDGHVLVLGAAGAGVSTALAALAPGAVRVPRTVAAAWDALHDDHRGVIAIDDVDALLARFSPDYRPAVVERLAALLRDGPARGLWLAVGARRVTAELQSLAALVPARLMLRHSSRHEWVLAGGEGVEWSPESPAGRGAWRGHTVQVARARVEPVAERVRVGRLPPGRPLAIVTTRPGLLLERLPGARQLGDDTTAEDRAAVGRVLVGDVEEWQSRWGALPAWRRHGDVVFDSCPVADLRALTRSRELPPPLAGLSGVAWLLGDDNRVSRVHFPVDDRRRGSDSAQLSRVLPLNS